jgi:hypothetical protein
MKRISLLLFLSLPEAHGRNSCRETPRYAEFLFLKHGWSPTPATARMERFTHF